MSDHTCAPAIVVSGFGRCGTSLVMQMLAAGGVPCLGEAPAFEDSRGRRRQPASFWTGPAAGHALKLLDPHRTEIGFPPAEHSLMIWLDRDPCQQALSHAKFSRLMLGLVYSRSQRRQLEQSLTRDRAVVYRELRQRPGHVVVQFEALLQSPASVAAAIADFIRWQGFDTAAAAAQVLPRGLECQSGLDIELGLMNRLGAAT